MEKNYINHLENCLIKANKCESNLNDSILNMEGMTGRITRHFYNNLLNRPNIRYLEIGTWLGSSLCSAMYKNQCDIVCIDNFSEFIEDSDISKSLIKNIEKYKGKNNVRFIEDDCFSVDLTELGNFNIYLYDGGHSVDDHYNALKYYINNLENTFIYVVDDWNWSDVRKGTFLAIDDLGLKILWKKEIILTENNEHTPKEIAKKTWWNGISIFLLEKKNDE
jgi:hypothetical protein